MLRTTKFVAGGLALAMMASLAVACGGDDDDMATSSSGSAAASSGSAATSSGSADSGTTTLYARLGGKSGIRSALVAIVDAELADPEVASFFFQQGGAPANGHPTKDAITDCLTNQLGMAAGGPASEVIYPTSVPNGSGMHTCRDMTAAHQGLGIYPQVFDKFVGIAGGVLTAAKVAPADINTIAGVLVSTKPMVVQSARTDDAGFRDGAP